MTNDLKTYKEATSMLTRKEKIAQSFMPAVYINDAEEDIRKMEQLIAKHQIGGICFFHSRASAATNFEGKKEVIYNAESLEVLKKLIDRYQKAAKHPLLISIDAEWGLAMRIENTAQYPYAICLGAMKDQEDLVYQVAQRIGADCRQAGIHWNFAPVADVNNNPENPVIGYRSFGEDPTLVARYATAFSKGLQSAGILTSAKHFPGHGDTATDSHLGLPVIDKSLAELYTNELIPFLKLIEEGVDSVMVGHLAVPVLSDGRLEPSSASVSVINNFLRDSLGFKGVVVSDALNMHAVSKSFDKKGALEMQAYLAGTDVLCYCENTVEGIDLIDNNSSNQEIETHFKRVWRLKEKVMKQKEASFIHANSTEQELMEKLAEQSLCMVYGSEKVTREFRTGEFKVLVVNQLSEVVFPKLIEEEFNTEIWHTTDHAVNQIRESLDSANYLLIALYPPSIKPADNFGLTHEELRLIEEMTKNKKVILYLFGNPYVLNLFSLEQFDAVYAVFQDFKEFQINAYDNFKGEKKALGLLPVTIKDGSYGNV